MATRDHVKIVLRGKNAIWKWRLSEKPLNLAHADLSDADLSDADLSGFDLRGANLSGANLSGANLRVANLTATDFSDSDLSNADFGETDLAGSIFTRALLFGTRFCNVDLSGAINLNMVNHEGPCTIGIDTLFRSRGQIPESFLLGCGVPADLITFLPSLLQAGIDFYSSFISYSHKDEDFARRLHARMQQEHLRVWYAPEDLAGGKKLHEQIFDAIRVHDKLLLVLSEHSMNSEWVRTEIRRARKREREENRQVLFPIRLATWDKIAAWECFDADGGKDLAVELREFYVPDFSNWKHHDAFEPEFAKLLRDLKKSEIMPGQPSPAASRSGFPA